MSKLDVKRFYPELKVGESYVYLTFEPEDPPPVPPTLNRGVGVRRVCVRPNQESAVMTIADEEHLHLVRRTAGVFQPEQPLTWAPWIGSGGPMDDD